MAHESLMRILLLGLVGLSILAASCDDEGSRDGSPENSKEKQPSAMSETTRADTEGAETENTAAEKMGPDEAAELARAEIGKHEITNMLPADGEKPDSPQPLPENPPKDIQVYPATTNRTVEGPIDYDRQPPTNGDHAPLWQTAASTLSPYRTGTPYTAWTTA